MAQSKRYPMAEAVRVAYRAGEEDESLEPIVLVDADGQSVGRVGDGDYVIFYDIRGEREIELTEAFVASDFPHFQRAPVATQWATMIEYDPGLDVRVAYRTSAGMGTIVSSISPIGQLPS